MKGKFTRKDAKRIVKIAMQESIENGCIGTTKQLIKLLKWLEGK